MKNELIKTDICFLILHYIDLELTKSAVASIQLLENVENSKIILVDNASPNGSGKELRQMYSNSPNIYVILLEKNLGFSSGNNWGYKYIKNKFDTEFIIAANNDVIFHQKNFISKLFELYSNFPFYVGGPDVYLVEEKRHGSPFKEELSENDRIKYIKKYTKAINECQKRLSFWCLKKYLKKHFTKNWFVRALLVFNNLIKKDKEYTKQMENCILSGSCLIFDKRFIITNQILFEPLTFLYDEEELLTLRCFINHWNTRYFPQLQVYHIAAGSDQLKKLSYRQACDKWLRQYELRKLAACISLEQIQKARQKGLLNDFL